MAGPAEYIRLPGASFILRRAYLAADHILLVHGRLFSQTYRRLYLDEVQAVFYAQTDDARLITVGIFAGAVSAAGLAAVYSLSPIGAAAAGAVLAVFVAFLLFLALVINVMLGASARCWVRTPRGQTQMPNVARLRAARRFTQALGDVVAQRQGVADGDAVAARLAEARGTLAGDGRPSVSPDDIMMRLPWVIMPVEAIFAGLSIATQGAFPPGIWVLSTVGTCAVLLILMLLRNKRWPFAYRALLTAAGIYSTAKSLHWGLYYFLLSTEQVVVFEIAESDLMYLGGATVAINVVMAIAGLVVSFGPRRVSDDSAIPPSEDAS